MFPDPQKVFTDPLGYWTDVAVFQVELSRQAYEMARVMNPFLPPLTDQAAPPPRPRRSAPHKAAARKPARPEVVATPKPKPKASARPADDKAARAKPAASKAATPTAAKATSTTPPKTSAARKKPVTLAPDLPASKAQGG